MERLVHTFEEKDKLESIISKYFEVWILAKSWKLSLPTISKYNLNKLEIMSLVTTTCPIDLSNSYFCMSWVAIILHFCSKLANKYGQYKDQTFPPTMYSLFNKVQPGNCVITMKFDRNTQVEITFKSNTVRNCVITIKFERNTQVEITAKTNLLAILTSIIYVIPILCFCACSVSVYNKNLTNIWQIRSTNGVLHINQLKSWTKTYSLMFLTRIKS